MGTRERRERERQELRQDILAAARAIAAHDGWQAVTIRKVADRIEYSPPTIYDYFDNKEAILLELMREGARLLLADLAAARADASDPEDALLRMARAYWDFAWTNPELYQVMHGMGGAPFCGDDAPAEIRALDEVIIAALRDLEQTGLTVDAPADAVDIAWATLHGLISLAMTDLIDGGRARGARLVDQATRSYLAALRAKPL